MHQSWRSFASAETHRYSFQTRRSKPGFSWVGKSWSGCSSEAPPLKISPLLVMDLHRTARLTTANPGDRRIVEFWRTQRNMRQLYKDVLPPELPDASVGLPVLRRDRRLLARVHPGGQGGVVRQHVQLIWGLWHKKRRYWKAALLWDMIIKCIVPHWRDRILHLIPNYQNKIHVLK